MNQQLSLPVNLPDDEVFESFMAGDNEQVVQHCLNIKPGQTPFITYLFGEQGCGKSHMLYAICHHQAAMNKHVVYISLGQMDELSPSVLSGLESCDLVCIDGLDAVEQDTQWQQALFDLINRLKEQGNCHLVLAARTAPTQLNLSLADLQSRLSWGLLFKLVTLPDSLKSKVLPLRAKRRGMDMSEDVSRFLINHYQRDMQALMTLLERLDNSSLEQQRKLTIPFVKSVLGQ